MNNLNEFERIIKDKVDSFEYPYDSSSWKELKKSVPGKSGFWRYAALFSVALIATLAVLYVYNNEEINDSNQSNLTNIYLEKSKITSENKTDNQADKSLSEEIVPDNKQSITENNNITDNEVIENNAVIPKENSNNEQFNKVNNINPISNNIRSAKPNATFICDKKEGCVPLTVKFHPLEISDSIIYSWDFGDGNISTEKSPQHVYSKDGSFSVTLNVKYYKSEAVVPNRQQNLIKVYDEPVAQFTWTNTDNSYTFQNMSTGAVKYKWILSDTISNEEDLNKIFRITGKHPVQLIAINKYGCSDIVSNNIDIKIEIPINIGNAFSPNGDADNDVFGPQVVDNDLYRFEFQIFNKYGKLVFESKGKASDIQWNGLDKSTNKIADPDLYFYDLIVIDMAGNKDHKNGKVTVRK